MKARYLELMARWYVFIFLNTYGLAKVIGQQFYRRGDLPADLAAKTVMELSAFELAWTFMGYSTLYVLFIGLSEMLGACLLLFERTKLIGVAVLFPIMVNILVFDVIFLDKYGALASAVIYTGLLVLILAINRDRVGQAARVLTRPAPARLEPLRSRAKTAALAVLLMAVLFGIDQFFVSLLGHGKG